MTKQPHRILIVEDEKDIAEISKRNLLRQGYDVQSTPDGREALRLIKEFNPELVLLDYSLNRLSGKDVLIELRKTDKETPVYMITGKMFDEEGERTEILELGVLDILSKARFTLQELVTLVDKFFGRHGPPLPPAVQANAEALDGSTTSESYRMVFHRLSNLISSMRNKCQNLTMAMTEGDYDDKSKEELKEVCLKTFLEIDEVAKETLEYLYQVKGKFSRGK